MENIVGITELNFNELIEIEGGHDGVAYEVGHYAAKALLAAGAVIVIIAFI
ncbi:hypothetical protein [Flavobacterium sp. ASV13]|uniref:hypothetical protein n=1 Tax=Flavobacterium sp. ASV13 TaxID=1506583 RepID=UPI000AAFFCBF|nr:hypothetical protein [Flavobacterium sp. ASV13]